MWLSYWSEKYHTKKVKIPSEIASIQPYISSYYDATRVLVEDREAKIRDLEQKPRAVITDNEGGSYWNDETRSGSEAEPLDCKERLQCSRCKMWFKNLAMLSVHACSDISLLVLYHKKMIFCRKFHTVQVNHSTSR